MRRFYCKLFVLLFAAVLALASFAGAAAGSQSQLRMHISDNSTVAAFCPTASQDTTTPQQCGHLEPIVFSVPGTYTVTVTVDCSTYPSSAEAPCDSQMVTPTLCQEQQGAVTGNCPLSSPAGSEGPEAEASCSTDTTVNNDGSTTYTSTCLVVPGTYELLLVPNFVDTCPSFMIDPMCGIISSGPGVDVLITTSFTPSGSIAAEPAKAHGAGQVGDGQKFSFHAWNDPSRYSKTKVRFEIKSNDATRCTFRANSATNVQITLNALTGGGTADIDGLGTVTDSFGNKTGVSYHVHAVDGGGHNGMGDTFQVTQLPVTTCGNANPALTHGNVDVDPAHGPKNS